MQVSVEAPSKIQRRMTIVIPVEQFDQAFNQRISKISKTVKMNGFRQGKVPLEVVKQRFGDAARQEAMSEVIQSSLYSAMNQEKLNPVNVPTVEPKNVTPGQPLEFVATFEVLPEIEKVNLALPTLEKETATIEEHDVDKVIEHLRHQHTKWQQVDRAAEDKDQVIVDFRGTIDGVVFNGAEAHDYPIVLGSKTMIPGFEEGIVGGKAGEDKVVKVTFPKDYFAKEVAGKVAEFAIKIIKVMAPKLPELDAEFIKKLGVKSAALDDLRKEIRMNLERELDRVIKTKLKNKIFDALLQQNSVEVPQALVENEAKRIHDQLHPHHKGHDHGHTPEEMATFNQAALRNVSLGLLMGVLIKEHKITPDKGRVSALIDLISASYEKPQEVMQWYTKNKQAMAEIEMQVLEEQVVEKLLENIQVTEKKLSYSELIKEAV